MSVVFFTLCTALSAQEAPDVPLRIDTNLIQTDVSVLDKESKFVDGLTREQFVLKIDGKPVKIDFFDKVVTRVNIDRAGRQDSPERETLSLRERHTVFYLDDFHLNLDSLARTRSAIEHFIDNDMLPRDQVAIFTGSGRLGFLQQFTNNKAVLRAALTKLRPVPNSVVDRETPPMSEYIAVRILNNDVSAANIYIDKILEGTNTKYSQPLTRAAALEIVKVRAANIVMSMTASTKNSLASLENVLRAMSAFKGRKIVFLFSDGFYLESKQVPYSTTEALQRAIDLSTRHGASIYAVDARGLFSLAGGDAAGERAADMSSRGLDRARVGEEADSQLGLATLADQTGGKFLKNQNYFDKWVDRVIDENSSYYVLAWTPEKDEMLNSKFRNIDVDIVGRPDLKVRQQRGYLTAPKKESRNSKNIDKKDSASVEVPLKKGMGKKTLPVELAVNYLDVPGVGGMANSSVQIDSNELDFGDKSDRPSKLYIEGTVFNTEGKQVADFKNGVTIAPPAPGSDPNARQSVIYGDKTPLAPGLYLVRARVGEYATGNSGGAAQWIEIPDLTKKSLTLGSIFLGGKLIETAGKDGDTGSQFQFSVDNRFSRPAAVDFMSFIYNATHGGSGSSGETDLSSRIEILDIDGRVVVDTGMRRLETKGNPDMARIPLRGSIRQGLNAPGVYLLRITVADALTGGKSEQQTLFTIE